MTPLEGGETIKQTGKGMCIIKRTETGKWQFKWNAYVYDSTPSGIE
jgi:hypothetical protein